jgi:hypothetical protein
VEKVLDKHPELENRVILADKGYIEKIQSSSITCLTPKKKHLITFSNKQMSKDARKYLAGGFINNSAL